MNKVNLYKIIGELHIKYDEVTHKAVSTVEEAIKEKIPEMISGIECKNLFVKDSDNYFYLILIKADKKADLKYLGSLVGASKLHFASDNELKSILNLEVGSVTPLGIINDKDNKVTLLVDKELKNNKVLVHPNVNTKTMALDYDDLIKIIRYTNHLYYTF